MTDDEISSSAYAFLAADYYDYAYTNKQVSLTREIDERLGRVFGKDWKAEVDKMKKSKMKSLMPPQLSEEEAEETEEETTKQ